MRIRDVLLAILFGCLTGLFEATFTTFLPRPFLDIRPVLPLLVGGILLQRSGVAMIFGVSAGLMVDVFSVGPTTLVSASNLALILLISFLARTVITNQSMYAAFALMFCARGIEWCWNLLAGFLWRMSSLHVISIAHAFGDVWRMLIWDELFLAVCFLISSFVLRRYSARRSFVGRS